ncbi:hypothetical protein D6D13_00233 [Aureobasidium pullulans]|uniref:CFEM domain-containing protein n=1 Tax=Aureobasidium pullulans TaxID=5580 RepID=A0A4S9H8H2_AURPU|nr:hypothetical protein D6D13_00233 [Aureobasidium pullulans]THX70019.1 hypothetical protein D6D05_08785 [Aureobasidium pullulans]
MQFRAYASIAIFFAGAMAASATSSASAAVSTPVDLTEGVPTCGLTCIQSAVASSGCEATDPICLCTTGSKAFLAAGTTCLLQNSDCSAEDLQNIQNLAKSRCGTLLAATGSSASGSAAASVSGSATAKAAAVSGSATSSAAAASATSTGGAMQVGASLMAVGAGAIAFIL